MTAILLCPGEAVDKILLPVKVRTGVETGNLYVILPQIIQFLQLTQVPEFGIQVFLCFCAVATA